MGRCCLGGGIEGCDDDEAGRQRESHQHIRCAAACMRHGDWVGMMIGGHITIAGSQGGFDFSAGGRQAHVASLLLAMISGWPETIRFTRDDGMDGNQYQD